MPGDGGTLPRRSWALRAKQTYYSVRGIRPWDNIRFGGFFSVLIIVLGAWQKNGVR
eukprot:COSAG02_NODE_488_length_21256_cov_9.406579_3_plen_56_part_00